MNETDFRKKCSIFWPKTPKNGGFLGFFGSKIFFSVFGTKMAQLAKKKQKIEKKILGGPIWPKNPKKKFLGPLKKKIFFSIFGIRMTQFVKKSKKKFFFDFFPIGGHPSGGDGIFRAKKSKIFIPFFFAN